MSGSGWEAHPDVREWSESPSECPAVAKWPSWLSGSGRETLRDVEEPLPNVREWSGVLPNVREWSGGYPKSPGVVRRPSWMSGSSYEDFPDVQEWSCGFPG